jgi:uncharacterized protein (TIGR02145 family)
MPLIVAVILVLLLSCSGNFEEIPYKNRAKASSGSVASSSSIEQSSSSSTASSSSVLLSSSSTKSSSSSSIEKSSSSSCTVEDNTSEKYCSNGEMKTYGSVCVNYGICYKTVIIGKQEWMADNLNIITEGKCPGNNTGNECFGRLYSWSIAYTICPRGWLLPDNDDWNTLQQYISELKCSGKASCNVGKFLKHKFFGGTDDFGFSAQLDGDQSEYNFGNIGFWWSASYDTEDDKLAYSWKIYSANDSFIQQKNPKNNTLSVRCMRKVN